MKNIKSFIDGIIKKRKTFIFVSLHFDDAVFSAGGLIYYLSSKKSKVEVIKVFTKATPPPYTLSAKRNLRLNGFSDALKLYKEREEEDRRVFRYLGVKVHNLGINEVLYRKKKSVKGLYINQIFPEFNHLYPTYFGHITKGKESKKDEELISNLRFTINNIVVNNKSDVFCPLANASHVDHVIVNTTCSQLFSNLIYWEDYPYNTKINIIQINNSKTIL
jgi:hypothetical protein